MTDIKTSFSNLKWWQATIMVVSILIASGFAAYEGANVNVNVSLDARLQTLEDQVNIPVNSTISAMLKEADYIVSIHNVSGTPYYCLMNGTDDRAGRLEFYNTNKTLVQQFAIGNLTTAGGGDIYLKDNTLNTSLAYGATILITESYHGYLSFYRNNLKLREIGDCPTVTSGTFAFPNGTTEQTIIELTPSVVTYLYNFWLDLNALTQNCTIKVYSKIDGTNYREIEPMILSNIDYSLGLVLKEQMINTAWKITIQSTVAEGASRNIPYRYFTEVWG